MTPQENAPTRSSVRITRNTKTVQAECHVYCGDTDLADAIAAAKAAFLDLDGFCQRAVGVSA